MKQNTPIESPKTEAESLVGVASTDLSAALNATDFESCEEGGDCEKCNSESAELFFGNKDYWDPREGDYWCGQCVINLHEANQTPPMVRMKANVAAGKDEPLSQDAKRIRIAEACGWSDFGWAILLFGTYTKGNKYWEHREVPNYFTDLNAMHEAEKTLGEPMCYDYVDNLPAHYTGRTNFALAHATAAERAEAFGLTLNLWEA